MLIGFKETGVVEMYDPSKKYASYGPEKIGKIIIPNVTDETMYNQFLKLFRFNSKYLESITWNGTFDLSKFNITELEMHYLSGCDVPKHIDLSGLRTHSITEIYNPFGACDGVESINLSNWDLSNVTSQNYYIDKLDDIPDARKFKEYKRKRNMSKPDTFQSMFPCRLFRNETLRKVIVKNCNEKTKEFIGKQLKYMIFEKEYVNSMYGGTSHEWLSFILESPCKWQYSEDDEEFTYIGMDTEYLRKINDAMSSIITFTLY